MHVLYFLSNLRYASDNKRDGFPNSIYSLKLIYLGSAVDQLVREKKVVFHLLLCHLLGHGLTYMSPSTISQSTSYVPLESMFRFNFCPNVNKSWPSGLIIMSPILDLVAGL